MAKPTQLLEEFKSKGQAGVFWEGQEEGIQRGLSGFSGDLCHFFPTEPVSLLYEGECLSPPVYTPCHPCPQVTSLLQNVNTFCIYVILTFLWATEGQKDSFPCLSLSFLSL